MIPIPLPTSLCENSSQIRSQSVHQQSATQSERAPNLKSASSADKTKTSASSEVVINKDAYRDDATKDAHRGGLRTDACADVHQTTADDAIENPIYTDTDESASSADETKTSASSVDDNHNSGSNTECASSPM